jgi:hypothetical protein
MNPFDIVNSISFTKECLLIDEKEYNAFLINRALSYHQDTAHVANEMNGRWDSIPPLSQYEYLRLSIRPRKRFSKWHKETKVPYAEDIAKFYGMSVREAKMSISALSEEQLKEIHEKIQHVGVQK